MKVGARAQTSVLYTRLGIMPVKLLYVQCLLMNNIVRNPDRTRTTIEILTASHTYDTRNSNVVRTPANRLCKTDKQYMTRYIKLLRMFSEDIQKICEELTWRRKGKAIVRFVKDNSTRIIEEFAL